MAWSPLRLRSAVIVLARGVGEHMRIGHDIRVTVLAVIGDEVRIGIDARAAESTSKIKEP
jgi:carbon storage regulator CsrA